jgi:RHS repeat-associated protein
LRVQKTEGGVATKYLFDGVRVYSEHDATMVEQARFMIEGGSYYSPLTAVRVGGAWYYPLYDKLGSTRRLADANQTVTDAYWYDAFGNIMSQAGSTVNPFRYVGALGYYRDLTTSLLHLGARYYSPSTGRFTTRDPAGTEGNPYVYASNAPAGSTDPSGRVNWGKLGTCGKEAACAFGAGALACGVTLGVIEEICIIACALTGPGWVDCAVACLGITNVGTVYCLWTVAVPVAGADLAACMASGDRCPSTPCLDSFSKFVDKLRGPRRPKPR